ncbi:MAG: type II toxin-antitoxin system RelE/ParE family toxin [Magnetococcales bacterium]|nr:type II toxin-antitoxin system RelE/ParE family toxin [Magnetococcales bacterium]MBF0418970.1 type II toxin-antitoxin system RelE/ParE family toxin [Magnetococcales bacterium]
MKPAQLSPQARRDVLDAARWLMGDNPSAARAFRVAIDKATVLLGEHPRAGRERLELVPAPSRFLSLTGFPYILVYDPTPTPPLILRVLHGVRDLPEILNDL